MANVSAQSDENQHLFIVENISLEGNTKTKDNVIFENLSFGIGDTLTENNINEGIERLNDLEIFSDVSMQPRLGSKPGMLDIVLQIEERYWPHFRFKGGYSELDGWFITPVSLNMDNIFGLGNFISLDLTLGDRITAVNLNYINTNIFENDLDFISRISSRNLNFVHYFENRWILPVEQGSVFFGFRSNEGFFKNFTFGVEIYTTKTDTFAWRYDSDDRLYDFPPEIGNFTGNSIKSALFKIDFNFDRRDQLYYPTMGWWIGSRIDLADTQLGSDLNFTRFIVDLRKYQTLYKKFILAGRIKYGHISYDAPFFEKFYLGGPNSLRGFNDRSLSPVGGGNQLYQADVELRFPITQKNYPKHLLSGVLFLDSGTNVYSQDFFTVKQWESALGFGLRLRLPFLGIVRADIAKPLNGDEKKIQFSLGHTF
ncbi:outer membrane protein assembly factor [Calditrichota bacterium]